MSQRTPSHWSAIARSVATTAAPQLRGERVQLHDVGPGREVGVAAVGEHPSVPTNEPGRPRSLGAARSTPGARQSTGGQGRRGSARSRGSARARAPRAPTERRRARPGRRGSRRPRSRGCSTASRRRPPAGSRAAPRRNEATSPSFSSAIAIPAGLRSQTPISQTASKPRAARASHSAAGTSPSPTGPPARALSSPSHTHVLSS